MPTTSTRRTQKRDTLNLRIKPDERGLIDRAAELTGKTRTDFVLEAARRAAVDALTQRTLFSVDAETYANSSRRSMRRRVPRSSYPHDADAGTVGSHLTIDAPVLLDDSHDLGAFDCGVPPLDEWLKRRARDNAASGGTHTYVACEGGKVVGYYALAAGAVEVTAAPGRFRRNMPDPIPIVVLGRLAIDRSHQGKGLGRALFRDAGLRVLQAAAIIGVRGVLVDAISKDAKAFYLALGMTVSPLDPMTLMVTLADLRASLTLGL